MGLIGKKKTDANFQFRVSDSVEVPMRGTLLRLKLIGGDPGIDDVAPGSKLRLRSPEGVERVVTVMDYSVTQGPASQRRLDRTRELDILIEAADAVVDNHAVGIGWTATRAS